jgi:hypothetical protein
MSGLERTALALISGSRSNVVLLPAQRTSLKFRPLSLTNCWRSPMHIEASSRAAAWTLREAIDIELAGRMEVGRFLRLGF